MYTASTRLHLPSRYAVSLKSHDLIILTITTVSLSSVWFVRGRFLLHKVAPKPCRGTSGSVIAN